MLIVVLIASVLVVIYCCCCCCCCCCCLSLVSLPPPQLPACCEDALGVETASLVVAWAFAACIDNDTACDADLQNLFFLEKMMWVPVKNQNALALL